MCNVSIDDGIVVNDTVDSIVMVFAHDNGNIMMAFACVMVVGMVNDDKLVM